MPRKRTSKTRMTWDDPSDRVDTITLGGRQIRRCNAQLRNSSPPRRCRKPACRNKLVCVLHGGTSPGGPLKHGRYSMKLGPLAAAYDSFMQEADILDLRPGVAALDSWAQFQIDLATKGDGVGFRRQAVAYFAAVETAMRSGDVNLVRTALEDLSRHLKDGSDQLNSLGRAMETLSRRQHHTERAREIEQRGDQVITAKALLAFLSQVVEIVRQELPKDADRVLQRLTDALLAQGARPGFAAAQLDPN